MYSEYIKLIVVESYILCFGEFIGYLLLVNVIE